MPIMVPGIGYAGLGQQTAAAQLTFRKAMGSGGNRGGRSTGVRRRQRTKARKLGRGAKAARRIAGATGSRRTTRRKGQLKKGSAAAKRYMAKIRKMRRR
jgi:hypothetical protein